MTSLGVVLDRVVGLETAPLGQGTVLLEGLGQVSLGLERLVRRHYNVSQCSESSWLWWKWGASGAGQISRWIQRCRWGAKQTEISSAWYSFENGVIRSTWGMLWVRTSSTSSHVLSLGTYYLVVSNFHCSHFCSRGLSAGTRVVNPFARESFHLRKPSAPCRARRPPHISPRGWKNFQPNQTVSHVRRHPRGITRTAVEEITVECDTFDGLLLNPSDVGHSPAHTNVLDVVLFFVCCFERHQQRWEDR